MIYITGDCHRNFERFNPSCFPEQERMTKEDCLIICGDFGGVWTEDCESREETMLLDWLECRPFTTLFVSGNHENYDRLKTYPVEIWNGGKVQKIRPHVMHLMRGQVFILEGRKFFTFGGAQSHDMVCVLEPDERDFRKKKRDLDRDYIPYRVNHISWWKEELPSQEEMEEGRRNLDVHGWNIDFIVTHCCSDSTQDRIGKGLFKSDILTRYLEEIKQHSTFAKWFFGHYHDNCNVNEKEILLYEQIIRII